MSIFGPIASGDQLEDAVLATLELWWKTYAREFELQAGLPQDALPEPRSYIVTNRLDKEAADQIPAIVAVSPGLARTPKQEGDGSFNATFGVGIGLFVSASTRRNTARLVRQYGAIVRAIMLQKQSLGGFADGTTWIDESYDDEYGFVDEQTVSAGQIILEITLSGIVNKFDGPVNPVPAPDTEPGSAWPTAQTVGVTAKTSGG